MKKFLSILLSCALALSLVACGAKEEATTPAESENTSAGEAAESEVVYDTYNFEVASVYTSNESCVKGTQMFLDLLEERSGGAITGTLYTDSALGTEQDCIQMVSTGGVDMCLGGANVIDSYATEYMFVGAHFLLKDWDHCLSLLEGELGQQLYAAMEDSGVKMLGVCNRGFRTTTCSKPFTTPEELSGILFRLPNMPTWVAIWEGLGAAPVTVALGELYAALQYGTAQASEGPMGQIAGYKLYEVQDYLVMTNHCPDPTWIYMNNALFESFNKDTQQLLLDCAAEAMAWATEDADKTNQAYIDECVNGGMEIVEIDRDAFNKAAEPILEDLFNTTWTVTTYDEVMSYAK